MSNPITPHTLADVVERLTRVLVLHYPQAHWFVSPMTPSLTSRKASCEVYAILDNAQQDLDPLMVHQESYGFIHHTASASLEDLMGVEDTPEKMAQEVLERFAPAARDGLLGTHWVAPTA